VAYVEPPPTLAHTDWLEEIRWYGPVDQGDPREIAEVVLKHWSEPKVAELRERVRIWRGWFAEFDAALRDARLSPSPPDEDPVTDGGAVQE
jgi:hypothetical protein